MKPSEIRPGARCQHYAGNIYEIVGRGEHSENSEQLVIYRRFPKPETGEPMMWARPLAMFCDVVKVKDGETEVQVERFRLFASPPEYVKR